MSRLVRLYPAAWRARYESEFQALLADRPPGLGDVVDTIRGAVDAHLHPHLVDDRDRFRQPWTHRLPGLIALSAGLLWTANLALVAVEGPTGSGNLSLLGTALLVMAVSLPGDYLAVHGRRIATALGLVGACLVSANLLPWALAQVPYLTGWAVVLAGMLALAAARAGVGAAGRWIFVAASVSLCGNTWIFAFDSLQFSTTIVPEPSTRVLAALGLLLLGGSARRRTAPALVFQ